MILLLALAGTVAAAQNEYFCETFASAYGTTAPDGWFNQDLIRGSYYNFVTEDLWHFDNPGEQEILSPMVSPVAVFDSDAYSATDNLPENVALTSPVFDTRGVAWGSTSIVVDWDQSFVEGYEAKIFVEVWTGHHWAEVYSETSTTFNPDHQLIDITEHVSNHGSGVESRVRFRWTGDASWFWAIDNVRVIKIDTQLNPNGCPTAAPIKCAVDGSCVADQSQCLLDNNCPASAPRRCLDGSCVAVGSAADDPSLCSDLVDCPADAAVRCADGSCQSSVAACLTASNCPVTRPQRCNDGSCAATVQDCPLTIACPDEFNPYPCRGGSCAAAPELCPTVQATDLVCPCDQVQCLDLTCVDNYSLCECPCEYPYLCTESRTCVQESLFCKDTSLPNPSVVPERFGGFGALRMVRVDECPAGLFRCFDGQCVPTLTQCPNLPCSSFETANGDVLSYKCPDGSCARQREDCAPIPACSKHDPANHVGEGRDWWRCPDGTCTNVNQSACTPVDDCSYGRVRCPDGRCYQQCPLFYGCPVDNPYQCPNGQCVASQVQCFAGCVPQEHVCYDGDTCEDYSTDCRYPPSDHRAVPFSGNLNCIAIREDSLFYDVVCVADRFFDDLFATVMVPAGIFERQDPTSVIEAFDVPLSEVRPLPPYPATISHVLGVSLPASIFAEGDFVRLSLRVELPTGFKVSDYCLAQLTEYDDGEKDWNCVDNNLVQDGVHFSGLVQNVDGVFIIMKKPGVCHNYRGFSDQQLEFIMLGRVIPDTISQLQNIYDRLIAIRNRLPEIKRSDAVLTYIAKATYLFTETCLNTTWQLELATFPPQLGYQAPTPPLPTADNETCDCAATQQWSDDDDDDNSSSDSAQNTQVNVDVAVDRVDDDGDDERDLRRAFDNDDDDDNRREHHHRDEHRDDRHHHDRHHDDRRDRDQHDDDDHHRREHHDRHHGHQPGYGYGYGKK